MTELNLKETLSDDEKSRMNRGAWLEEDSSAPVELFDCRHDTITPEDEVDAAKWKIEVGRSVLMVKPAFRCVEGGVNTANRIGRDNFKFVLDASGAVDEEPGSPYADSNAKTKGALYGMLRAFHGGKDNMPDDGPVFLLVNNFDKVRGLQARCDISPVVTSAKGNDYQSFRSWKQI